MVYVFILHDHSVGIKSSFEIVTLAVAVIKSLCGGHKYEGVLSLQWINTFYQHVYKQ